MEAFQSALNVARRTVFLWKQQGVPAERVPEIEAATGISRHALRPDLWPAASAQAADPLREGRANLYALLGHLLSDVPDPALLARLTAIPADESPIGRALGALAAAARVAKPDALEREYHDLFIGLGRGELLPYASYYLTGFLHERPLAAVRQSFVDLGIIREDGSREPEDHIALLFDVMANLAAREIGEGYETEKAFFEAHLKPWAGRFFADLESMTGRPFYAAVGAVGRLFVAIEDEAFSFDA